MLPVRSTFLPLSRLFSTLTYININYLQLGKICRIKLLCINYVLVEYEKSQIALCHAIL